MDLKKQTVKKQAIGGPGKSESIRPPAPAPVFISGPSLTHCTLRNPYRAYPGAGRPHPPGADGAGFPYRPSAKCLIGKKFRRSTKLRYFRNA